MVHHLMISLNAETPNVTAFKARCRRRNQTCEVLPGRRISSVSEAKPWLTSYGYYIMNNWRESSCQFDTTGPVGCFLAHREAWAICVARDEHVWIFEEGVYAYEDPMFDRIKRRHPTTDLIRGHTIPLLRIWKQRSIGKRAIDSLLTTVDKIYYGSKCYRLSPAFAARLLQNSMTFDTHVDTFICTQAIQHADEFSVTRTYTNIVSAVSSGSINHSIDHSLLIMVLLVVGLLSSMVGLICLHRVYRRCRTRCSK
jgi:hypothetical protein